MRPQTGFLELLPNMRRQLHDLDLRIGALEGHAYGLLQRHTDSSGGFVPDQADDGDVCDSVLQRDLRIVERGICELTWIQFR